MGKGKLMMAKFMFGHLVLTIILISVILHEAIRTVNRQKFKEKKVNTIFISSNRALLQPKQSIVSFKLLSTREMTHTDGKGKAKMVDVGEKEITKRTATAFGMVYVGSKVAKLIEKNNIKKGDVLSVARLAGIMAAKKTSDLIPLCHNIVLNDVQVDVTLKDEFVVIEATVKCNGKTGVEMEALTSVSIVALTIYDMCKAVTHDMSIKEIKLLKKTGGSRGDFQRPHV